VAFGVLSIVYHYNKAYIKLIKNLEEQNAELKMHRENLEGLVTERSKELELANEELTTANEELYQSKNIIETQNIELRSTLDHLQETQTKLVQSEKMASLGVLSAGVAHEINNPLNFINGGYLGLKKILKTSGIESDSNVELCLTSIKTGVERASNIVNALNQFSRSNTATNEKCTAQTIIDNCLTVLSNQYDQKIVIEKQYDDTLLTITGNCGKLHHVFFNILTNAFYALNGEGKIIIATSQSDNKIIVEIKDTGCGISEEHLERVTDPFFTTKDPGEGTGLGLSIAYSIIKEHNGKLEINSELSKGTCVRISFPK
jgi:C4-dicarboxylate-specific signal transduction histidine kinase